MTLLPLALMILMGGDRLDHLRYGLVLDGKEIGRFSAIERSDPQSAGPESSPPSAYSKIELGDGWIDIAAFDLWLEAAAAETGRIRFRDPDPSQRPRAQLALVPAREGDARRMRRSWTLFDACPLSIEVDRIDETGKAWLRSLVLSVGDFAAER